MLDENRTFIESFHGKGPLPSLPLCQQPMHIVNTIYGSLVISEPVLVDLLNCKSMQRLKHINQYGAAFYVNGRKKFTRYNHSVGVFFLLQTVGVSLHEQIAGLLHDISHTIFSHVADFLFDHHDTGSSYQDDIHEWFLRFTEIPDILAQYGITTADVFHKNKHFLALDCSLPDICADRLDYILYGGVIDGIVPITSVHSIVQSLKFDPEHRWYFTDVHHARQFADISLHLTEHHFGSARETVIGYLTAQILKRALHINIITMHDIHFSTDEAVWHTVQQCADEQLQQHMRKLFAVDTSYQLGSELQYDLHVKPKFRCVNPWVFDTHTQRYHRLTDIDAEFAATFARIKALFERGYYVQFT